MLPPRPGAALPRSVLVFRRRLLARSETFILDHVSSLRRYEPTLIGLSRASNGLPLDDHDVRLLAGSGSTVSRARFALARRNRRLDEIIAELRPALLHVHFVIDALHILPAVARHRIPLLVTAHGYDVSVHPQQLPLAERSLYRSRITKLIRRTAKVLCVSNLIRGFAIERGFPADRCVTHYLGIPYRDFLRPDSEPIPGRILFVGRLVEKKGLHHLLRAAHLLQTAGIGVGVRIVGEGPQRKKLEAFAAALGVPAHFLGLLSREQVSREMSQAWVFCMPSQRARDGDSEGLPIVYLEAQAAGLPVVAYDSPPANEAIRHGRTGLLARAGDVPDLAAKLEALLVDRELRTRYATAAVAWIASRFDLARNSVALEQIYDQVASAADGPAQARERRRGSADA